MHGLTAVCLVLAAGATGDEVPPVRLTLSPRAAPSPALRYRLLPHLLEQTPGDAGPLYRRAVPLLQKLVGSDSEQLEVWLGTPLGDLPRAEVRRFLDQHGEALRLLDQAARRESCDWGLSQRVRQKGFATLLSELGPLRQGGNLLAVRARLEMAEGRTEEALRALQTGLALARHVGEAPLLISSLVGNALATVTARQVEEFVQLERAPNLYWALTDLPRPFFSLRQGFEGDRLAAYSSFPGLAEAAMDPRAGPLRPEQVEALSKAMVTGLRDLTGFRSPTVLALAIRAKHETAKRALVAQGRPRELVERMPHVQVALLHALLEYDRVFDESAKWKDFPYWEARPHLERLARPSRAGFLPGPDEPVLPFARTLLSSLDRIILARTRIERRLGALRCVEALRLYAAAHRRLPASPAEVREVPVPVDPLTGKPFTYRLTGNRATLSGSPTAEQPPRAAGVVSYEVVLRP